MDNGGADIPKIYQVVKLNAGELHYKDNLGKIYYFSKILVH
jgi:hypothetical protein